MTTCGSMGSVACNAACQIPNQCTPPAEVCNGKDDDCDGVIDNGLSLFGQDVVPTPSTLMRPVVAFSGSVYGVAMIQAGAPGRGIYLQVYDQSAHPLGSLITVDTTTMGQPAIAWTGTAFALAWPDAYNGTGVFVEFFTPAGVPIGPRHQIATFNSQDRISILSTPAGLLVGAANYVPPSSPIFNVFLVDIATGQVTASNPVRAATATGRVLSSVIAPPSAGFRIFWSDNRAGQGHYAAFDRALDMNGVPTGSETAVTNGVTDAELWSAATLPTGDVLGIADFVAGKTRLHLVDSTGAPQGSPTEIYPGAHLPAVSLVGSHLMVAVADQVQMRDPASLSLLSSFPFPTSAPAGTIQYATMTTTSKSAFVWSTFDGNATTNTTGRLIGDLACNAPQ